MKKILYITLLSIGIVSYGQNKRVGINKKNPQQTLDINGGMRIGNTEGQPDPNNIPLAIDKTTKQVLKGTGSVIYPFNMITYKININKSKSFEAKNIDLKIDADKYKAIITQAYLVKSSFNAQTSRSENAAFIPISARNENSTEVYSKVKINDGTIVNEQGTPIPNDTDHYNKNRIHITFPLQNVKLEKKPMRGGGNHYFFSGNYKDVTAIDNGTYSWVVDVLVVKKSLVKISE